MRLACFVFLFFSNMIYGNEQPSFDCSKAKSVVENSICKNSDLSYWDNLLAETFNKKKSNVRFKKDYLSWLKDRDSCNLSGEGALYCLRGKYATILGLIYTKYDGPEKPIIPKIECFRPFLPQMNGDQGFYAVRLISTYRGCDNLNLNLAGRGAETKYEISFIEKKLSTYFYKIRESKGNENYYYRIGVQFEAKKVMEQSKEETTLVMSLVEAKETGI